MSIALKRDYFAGFYRDLSNGEPGMSVGLFRRDGGILVREPPSRAGITHVLLRTTALRARTAGSG